MSILMISVTLITFNVNLLFLKTLNTGDLYRRFIQEITIEYNESHRIHQD